MTGASRNWAFDVNDEHRTNEDVEADLRLLADEMRYRGVQANDFEIIEAADTIANLRGEFEAETKRLVAIIEDLEERSGIKAQREAHYRQWCREMDKELRAEKREQFRILDGGKA